MRRAFELQDEDGQFLDELGREWETFSEGGNDWLVIKGVAMPSGYNEPFADLGFLLKGYPQAEIKMVRVSPALTRKDNRAIPSVSTETFDGKSWQCWSRHRPDGSWRSGIDGVGHHYYTMYTELEKYAQ